MAKRRAGSGNPAARQLHDAIARTVIEQEAKLTANQIRYLQLSLEKPFWEQHELDEIELETAKIEPNTGAREVDPRARNPA